MWECQERRIIKQAEKNKLGQASRNRREPRGGEKKKVLPFLAPEQTSSYSLNSLGFLGSFLASSSSSLVMRWNLFPSRERVDSLLLSWAVPEKLLYGFRWQRKEICQSCKFCGWKSPSGDCSVELAAKGLKHKRTKRGEVKLFLSLARGILKIQLVFAKEPSSFNFHWNSA